MVGAIYIIFGLVISNLFYLDFTWPPFAHSFIRAWAVIVIIISELLARGVYLILSLNLALIPHSVTCYSDGACIKTKKMLKRLKSFQCLANPES